MAKQMIYLCERGKGMKHIEDIPGKVIDGTVEEAIRAAKEYWKKHGSREDWTYTIVVDSGVYF